MLNKFQNRLADLKHVEDAAAASRSQLAGSIAETASRTNEGGARSNLDQKRKKNNIKLREYVCLDNLPIEKSLR